MQNGNSAAVLAIVNVLDSLLDLLPKELQLHGHGMAR
jgi:hypothetical protein